MDSKINIKSVLEILLNIRNILEDKFVLYMDNDAKHVSVETLKWYSSCEIETGTPHSLDINPIENVWEIIKKSSRNMNAIIVDELKTRVKSIYDEIPISEIQNWLDSIRECNKRVLAIDGKHLNLQIIKTRIIFRCLAIKKMHIKHFGFQITKMHCKFLISSQLILDKISQNI